MRLSPVRPVGSKRTAILGCYLSLFLVLSMIPLVDVVAFAMIASKFRQWSVDSDAVKVIKYLLPAWCLSTPIRHLALFVSFPPLLGSWLIILGQVVYYARKL